MLREIFFSSSAVLGHVFKRPPSRADEHSILLADDFKRRPGKDQGISCYLLNLSGDNPDGISELEAIYRYWKCMSLESQTKYNLGLAGFNTSSFSESDLALMPRLRFRYTKDDNDPAHISLHCAPCDLIESMDSKDCQAKEGQCDLDIDKDPSRIILTALAKNSPVLLKADCIYSAQDFQFLS
jgi:hypothetical protein